MNQTDELTDGPDLAPETIEQAQETTEPPHKAGESEASSARQLASQLIAELEHLPDGDLVGEIVENAMKLLRDQTNRGDIKLINKAMKEIRYALKVFAPYRDVRKVTIFGSARTPEDDPDYIQALKFARAIAAQGWMVTTGAGGGIMAAGHGGAGAGPSFGLAIRLPFEQENNKYIASDKKLINFKYFFTRKLLFVRSCHALVLFPGGFGTMDEGFEVLTLIQTGKSVPMPVVLVERPGGTYWRGWLEFIDRQMLQRGLISPSDLHLFKITDDCDEAIGHILHFYSNYHSMRTVREELVIRLQRRPSDEQLQQINRDFPDILAAGLFRISGPLPVESDEQQLSQLPRLVFQFNHRDTGRLRQLIDHLNDLPT
jgi:uncharacterized protein (TIGR00730 family)